MKRDIEMINETKPQAARETTFRRKGGVKSTDGGDFTKNGRCVIVNDTKHKESANGSRKYRKKSTKENYLHLHADIERRRSLSKKVL